MVSTYNYSKAAYTIKETLGNTIRIQIDLQENGIVCSNCSRYLHPTRDILYRILELQDLNTVFKTNRDETNGGIPNDYMKVIKIENRNVVVASDSEIVLINGGLFQTDNQSDT